MGFHRCTLGELGHAAATPAMGSPRTVNRNIAADLGGLSSLGPCDSIPTALIGRVCQWRLSNKYVWTGLTRSPSNEYYVNLTRNATRLWVWFKPNGFNPAGVEAGWVSRDPVTIMYSPEQYLPWHKEAGNNGFAIDWAGCKGPDIAQLQRQGAWQVTRVAPKECM